MRGENSKGAKLEGGEGGLGLKKAENSKGGLEGC